MAFEIHMSQKVANIVGTGNITTVENLTINNGFLTVGVYNVPFHQIILVKEV